MTSNLNESSALTCPSSPAATFKSLDLPPFPLPPVPTASSRFVAHDLEADHLLLPVLPPSPHEKSETRTLLRLKPSALPIHKDCFFWNPSLDASRPATPCPQLVSIDDDSFSYSDDDTSTIGDARSRTCSLDLADSFPVQNDKVWSLPLEGVRLQPRFSHQSEHDLASLFLPMRL